MATFNIRRRDINQAVGGLRFDQGIVKPSWTFRPSIGLVARDIQRLGLALENMREPLSLSVIEVMMPSIRANFQAEGRPPWEPLSPVTIQFRNGATGPILHRTGNLQRAATSFKIWSISNTSATVKNLPSSVWYGVLHQEGFGGFKPFMQAAQSALGSKASFRDITRHAFELLDAARGGATSHRKITIPQRQFIMYQDEDIDSIQEVFADWMEREARRVGRFGTAVRGL